ncbi:MAG TPA: HAD-IB family hydrolase [Dehalococcoidia bacterium]|nr:HAD-IB family hydrolase [Dehalococcoidia bacterium]
MAGETTIAAIFDFDGTLFRGHLWQGLMKCHIKHKVKLPSVIAFLSTHIMLSLFGEVAAKLRIVRPEAHKIRWGEDLATLLKGFSKEEGLRIFEWISDNYFMKLARPDTMALLGHHKSKGHVTVLISGSFSDFLETIRQKIGVDYAVGTELEVIDNVYSGRIIRPLCFGVNKVRLLNSFFSQAELEVDLGQSFAYADSIVDAPMLEMVGRPVAVYPDKHLLIMARRKGWYIVPQL